MENKVIEKIKRYIAKYGAPRNLHYDIGMKAALAIACEVGGIEAIYMAFNYGRAKGYRAAKAEVKRA